MNNKIPVALISSRMSVEYFVFSKLHSLAVIYEQGALYYKNNMKIIQFLLLALVVSITACAIDDDLVVPICNPTIVECIDETIELDTLFLNQESIELIPYTGDEIMYFKNEAGDEVKF